MLHKYALGLACGLASLTSIFAQTVPPPSTKSTPTMQPYLYPISLYRMNDVGKSLNLMPNQISNLNKLSDQMQKQYQDNYSKLSTLNATERVSRQQELNRQYNVEWNKGAHDVFNDTQRTRYQQFNYQYGGFNSLNDPDVQKRLNLTADQVKDLGKHADWNNQQWEDINRTGAADPAKGTKMYGDYWTQHQERFNKFLTPEQQKSWLEMTGEPYTFQPSFTPPK